MNDFDQWKARLEAEATAHDSPDAVYERIVRAEADARHTAFDAMMRLFEMYFEKYPEKKAIRLTIGYINSEIDRALAACQRLCRQYPENTDALLDYWKQIVDFYKGLIGALKEGMQA